MIRYPLRTKKMSTPSIHPLHSTTVVVSDGSGRVFEYWHVDPCMTSGHATAYETVIGHVRSPACHVHFSERMGSTYVNPLRLGAMSPYGDDERPVIVDIRFERAGREVARVLHRPVDVVVEAYDPPTLPVPPPWDDIRLTPALVRWRVVSLMGTAETPWGVAFDARRLLPRTRFFDVYAPETQQNRDDGPGRYLFYLSRGWCASHLGTGMHAIELSAMDVRRNESTKRMTFVVGDA